MSVHEDVRLVREHGLECFFAVAGFGRHLDVAFDFEQGSERPQHHALIFGEDHTDRVAVLFEGRH